MKNDPTFVRDSNSSLKLLTFQLSNVRELETTKYTFDFTLGCKFFCAENNLGILRRGPRTTQDTHVINFYWMKRSLQMLNILSSCHLPTRHHTMSTTDQHWIKQTCWGQNVSWLCFIAVTFLPLWFMSRFHFFLLQLKKNNYQCISL